MLEPCVRISAIVALSAAMAFCSSSGAEGSSSIKFRTLVVVGVAPTDRTSGWLGEIVSMEIAVTRRASNSWRR